MLASLEDQTSWYGRNLEPTSVSSLFDEHNHNRGREFKIPRRFQVVKAVFAGMTRLVTSFCCSQSGASSNSQKFHHLLGSYNAANHECLGVSLVCKVMNKNVDAELRLLQDSSALFKSFAISLLLSVAERTKLYGFSVVCLLSNKSFDSLQWTLKFVSNGVFL
ncbi:hypothetical protein SDJN03_13366, partial [Cucurbita argyrosperma subsp. sororia]